MKKLYLLLLVFGGCERDSSSGCPAIACTDHFATIMVRIENPGGEPVALDSFKVTDLKSDKDLTMAVPAADFELMRDNGSYPIFSDHYSREYRNKETGINFKGFVDDQEVVSADFRVGADCCHVMLVSGDPTIVIE